ncbi:MAG: hypothetical protein V2I33_07185 [Kangiellaceae bacterium]|nr:hypothetical protein [Kangiellaceae bacterium]
MNYPILILSIVSLLTAGCSAPTAPARPYVPKAVFPMTLNQTAPKASVPYIKIGSLYYTFPKQCLSNRAFGDAADKRQFGDAADKRQFGDAADKRQFGDAADKRQFGDAADKRQFGDAADKRQFGDAADKRQFGDAADKRQFGDAADKRQFGDAADKRQFGDAADKRQFGDAADKRQFGDAASQFKCIMIASNNSVYVTGFVGSELLELKLNNAFVSFTRPAGQLRLQF